MEKLFLTVACGDYDRTRALQDGTVQAEGIRLNFIPMQAEEIFWRMGSHREFDASEMSLSNAATLLARGESPFVLLPVFPSRYFRHSCVFINEASGIRRPQDLKGKRVGAPEYSITAAVWIRGFLQDDYGVRPEDVQWLIGGQEEPGRRERIELSLPPQIKLSAIGPEQTLNGMLEKGEIDAMISARVPSCFVRRAPGIRRLFPNYKEVEVDYYRRTKIFPIMHVIVLRRDVHERHPWVARSLYKAFCEAKTKCLEAFRVSNTLVYTLPWLFADIEELREVFGADWWPYGIEPNRHTLEKFLEYMSAQGLLEKKLAVEDLFPPNLHGEHKI
ncbi:MAG TPA: ABC transporter substrate-binding protein [Candidatus Acidoferrales bacterium]|nr:ABC transporter substrate-binding protein [Candidatus Acidoferrales bacterium]